MVGIDEVGRGAWAGPLLVCAVRINKKIIGLKDSKRLSPNKRQKLSDIIIKNADVGYGWVCASEIDDIGLSEALKLATAKALIDIDFKIYEELVIDGNINFVPDIKAKVIPKADNLIAEVSAASIVAKVARDNHMQLLAQKYPKYGFEKHVGYGTNLHLKAICTYGFCEEHRRSYKIQDLNVV